MSHRKKEGKYRRLAAGACGTAAALAAWHLLSLAIGSVLILPGPREVLATLSSLVGSPEFWNSVAGTLKRVFLSFALTLMAGSITGMISAIHPFARDFLAPILTTIRATPVLALILIAMFWLPSSGVPVLSAFLMAYPIIHVSAYTGMASIDAELLEMASVFKVPSSVQFFSLRLPAARGHFLSGAKNALGLCWKVVVAGEVLSQPAFALGTGLQDSRLSLDTSGVLAWAVATVFLCGMSEFVLGLAARRFGPSASGERA